MNDLRIGQRKCDKCGWIGSTSIHDKCWCDRDSIEIWKDIEYFDGWHQISSNGRIRSWRNNQQNRRKKPKILKTKITNCGYVEVNISYNGGKHCKLVHRLVAKAFVENPKNKPCVNHKDGDKTNNNFKNLQWVTHKENTKHGRENGLIPLSFNGEKNGMSQLTRNDVLDIRNAYRLGCFLQKDIAEAYGVSTDHINAIINKRRWAHV